MFYLIFIILIIISLWIFFRYYTEPVIKLDYKVTSNKNVAIISPHSIRDILVTPDDLNKDINIGNFIVQIAYVQVIINPKEARTIVSESIAQLDNTKQIIVYVKYNNRIYSMRISGLLTNYRNLLSTNILLNSQSTQFYNITYALSIKSVYVNDKDEGWNELIISLNKYVETASDDLLFISSSNKPNVINLENPINEELYDDNRHAYRTPYRPKIDLYGVIYKKNQDNISRMEDTIRANIKETNDKIH